MDYELSILDRLVLMQVMAATPPMGGRMFHREFQRISAEISFSQAEVDEYDLQTDDDGGRVTWDDAKARDKSLHIPDCIERMIVKRLREMDEQEQLLREHIPVYDKFVPEDEEAEPEE